MPQEYVVKAKYLINIPLFSEVSSPVAGTAYPICLMGDTFLERALLSFKGKTIKNLPLEIRRVEDIGQAEGCRMLFVASSERHRLQSLLPEAHNQRILTISDMPGFTRLGGVISLETVNDRVVFNLNLAAAERASITFSSHLIKLAHDIVK